MIPKITFAEKKKHRWMLIVGIVSCCILLITHWMLSGYIMTSVVEGELTTAKRLLLIDPFLVNTRFSTDPLDTTSKDSMLMVAISNEDKKMVHLLVEKGADINHRNSYGTTALHYAVRWGDSSIVTLLLKHNADPNAKADNSETPMSYAIANGHKRIAAILRHQGAKDAYSIYEAAAFGDLSSLYKFVNSDTKLIDQPSARKWPPILYAASNGQAEAVEYLLQNNAKTHPDVLHFAAQSGSVSVVSLLLLHGYDINSKGGVFDEQPLYIAAEKGDVNMVEYLLSRGANTNVISHGYTPLEIARKENHEKVVRLIEGAQQMD